MKIGEAGRHMMDESDWPPLAAHRPLPRDIPSGRHISRVHGPNGLNPTMSVVCYGDADRRAVRAHHTSRRMPAVRANICAGSLPKLLRVDVAAGIE